MDELDDKLYDQITLLSEEGNELADEEKYEEALEKFCDALKLIPTPKIDWEASMWLYASIGDMYFSLEKYQEASDSFFDALNCPDGQANAFVHLRLGESLFETKQKDKAKEHLLQAYMLDGEEIFSEEDPKYFQLIKDII
jgi:tetratricopeptide (TPR) repeat protein